MTLKEKVNKILVIGKGHHPDELCCDLCDKRDALLQAFDEAMEQIIGGSEEETWYNKDLITEDQKLKEMPIRYRNQLRVVQRARKATLLGGKGKAMKIAEFETGEKVPKGSIYLTSIVRPTLSSTTVCHYFLVEEES